MKIEMDYSKLSINDLLTKILRSDVIDWQNELDRQKNYKKEQVEYLAELANKVKK